MINIQLDKDAYEALLKDNKVYVELGNLAKEKVAEEIMRKAKSTNFDTVFGDQVKYAKEQIRSTTNALITERTFPAEAKAVVTKIATTAAEAACRSYLADMETRIKKAKSDITEHAQKTIDDMAKVWDKHLADRSEKILAEMQESLTHSIRQLANDEFMTVLRAVQKNVPQF